MCTLDQGSFSSKSLVKREAKSTTGTDIIQQHQFYSKFVTWKQLYIELAIVFDNSMFRKYSRDFELLNARAKRLTSLVSYLYQPLNIKVALVNVEVWSDRDLIQVTGSSESTLDQFHKYRKLYMTNEKRADAVHLITDKPLDKGVVGKAIKGGICSSELSDAVIVDHSSREMAVAATMAHELGHSFGMEHDDYGQCECPLERCIMAASSGSREATFWSSCSVEYLSWSLSHGGDFCLKNFPPRKPFSEPICGNGFIEDGEQCDCGLPEVCLNRCCDAKLCKLKETAICASGGCCDLETCQLKEIFTVCRPEQNDCDLPETCDGKLPTCPNDTFKHDGFSCNKDQNYCNNGNCASHEQQCKVIWGPTATDSDPMCYTMNKKGSAAGSCHYVRFNDTYKPCREEDRECGMLHCSHSSEKTMFGDKPVVKPVISSVWLGNQKATCNGVTIDLTADGDPDPGFVPDGSVCAKKSKQRKICSKRQCVTVESILSKNKCSHDCLGRGICNNLGHCHCEYGYGGVDCSIPGLGGSIDSGPIGSTSHLNFTIIFLIFIFAVLPILIIVLWILYRRKKIPKCFSASKLIRSIDTLLRPNKSKPPPRPPQPRGTRVLIEHSASPDNGQRGQKVRPATVSFVSEPEWPEEPTSTAGGRDVTSTLPARPKRPDPAVLKQLYNEAPELTPGGTLHSEQGTLKNHSLMQEVLTAVDLKSSPPKNVNSDDDVVDFVPHRRAPNPPKKLANKILRAKTFSDNKIDNQKTSRNGAKVSLPVVKLISNPQDPKIGGQPTDQASNLTIVSTLKKKSQKNITLQRSTSGASRPGNKPPPPPKEKSIDSGKPNYYDVLNGKKEQKFDVKNDNEENLYADIDDFRKSESSPKPGAVGRMAALFDKK